MPISPSAFSALVVTTKQTFLCPICEDSHRIERCVKYVAVWNVRGVDCHKSDQSRYHPLLKDGHRDG
ncbi:Monodictyphenone cluster transcription factor [Trichinella spiralis]|uniref:Monodictyphenone cluster transcription factor n=1 Tax=Trichinella spiralis TaxID=6334 RepID=A0ABR3KZY1_TRISP